MSTFRRIEHGLDSARGTLSLAFRAAAAGDRDDAQRSLRELVDDLATLQLQALDLLIEIGQGGRTGEIPTGSLASASTGCES
jgi:hypothetical protein